MYQPFLVIIILVSVLFASSNQHIPPCSGDGDHTGSICHGYAVARAFGRTSSSYPCNAETFYTNLVSGVYFTYYTPFSEDSIEIGDIIDFQDHGHSAYVSGLSPLRLDQVDNKNHPEVTNLFISEVIKGNPIKGVTARGNPTGYYKKKKLWKIKARNKFDDGVIYYDGDIKGGSSTKISPAEFGEFNWEDSLELDAVMDGQIHRGFLRNFLKWQDKDGIFLSPTKIYKIEVDHIDHTQTPEFTAVFLKAFNINFQNNFVNIGNTGKMVINGDTCLLPHDPFPVAEGSSITADAIFREFNHIKYTFDHWSDGHAVSWREIIPDSNETYTAYFIGKPAMVQNVFFDCQNFEPVKLVWDQHPNSNCSYRIYRKTRDQWGNTTGPDCIATRSNGTTTYTDYDYIKTPPTSNY